ncbi:MAG: CBS domain-containing protein [Pirellulaceae bacterium]|nr:CBS domain-containing protein [Pirellulaceae bacterium]
MIQETTNQFRGTVRDTMTRDVVFADCNSTICEISELMVEKNLRRMVVIDERKKVLGVVSQRDVLKHYVAIKDKDADTQNMVRSRTIDKILPKTKPITISPDLPVAKAMLLIAANKIGCLPVVGFQNELIGLLTVTDLLRQATGKKQNLDAVFQFFIPNSQNNASKPAYIRKSSLEIVVPLNAIDSPETIPPYVVLGYDPPTGRILLKFLEDAIDGALRTREFEGNISIEAKSFIDFFDLTRKVTAFNVTMPQGPDYVVLTPKKAF